MTSTPDRPETTAPAALAGVGRGSLWLGGSTIASQLTLLLGLPLLARAYSPHEFGLYTAFVGVLAISSVFVGLRYESAAVLPRRAGAAATLLWLVLASGAVAALLVAGAGIALEAAGMAAVPVRHAWPLALALMATGLQRAFVAWCTRERRYVMLGVSQFAAAALTLALQLLAARVLRADAASLIWSHAVVLLAVHAVALLLSLRGHGALMRRARRGTRLLAAARRYRRFPLFMLPYGLSSTLRERGLQLLLAAQAGADVLGRFAVASRLTGAPNSLCYGAVAPVFFGTIVRPPPEAARQLATVLVELSAVALVPPFVFLAIDAPLLVDGLLGGEWSGSGTFVRLLAAPMLVLALTGWLDRVFDARQRQGLALALDGSFSVVVLLAVAMALGLGAGGTDAVALIGGMSLLYYAVYAGIALHFCGLPPRRVVALGGGCVALAALAAAVFLLSPAPSLVARAWIYGAFHLAVAVAYAALPGRVATLRALAGSRRV
ncbi:MAG: oligosaccharide flippase family protein [Steroidobacteraceae bacterium]